MESIDHTILLPTVYFPNLEYFTVLLRHRQVSISLAENFPKQTFRNRCVILNANGTQTLSVPLIRDTASTAKEVRISYAEDWKKNHLRSLESAYRRTPYYEYYIDDLIRILNKEQILLADLNTDLLHFLIEKTGLSCKVSLDESSEIQESQANLANPKHISDFKAAPYIQTFVERYGFVPNLSILDLLFNEGPNSICILQESTGSGF